MAQKWTISIDIGLRKRILYLDRWIHAYVSVTPVERIRELGPRIESKVELATHVLSEFLAMVRTRKGKQNVKTKAKACKCLNCEKNAEAGCRGNCSQCFRQFEYERDKKADLVKGKKAKQDAKAAFDKQQVDLGRVWPSRRGRKEKKPNPFAA